jgi:hypothetical protein
MIMRLFIAGLVGLAIGVIIGWLAFDSVFGGIGIGIAMGAGVCGVLIAYGFEQS